MRLLLSLILAAGAWAACPTGGGYTSTCFVATTGNDTTGDGTISAPFATLSKALTAVAAGDTIMYRYGTYSDVVSSVTVTGTSSAPITIRNFPGEVVKIDGKSATAGSPSGYTHWFQSSTSASEDVGWFTFHGLIISNWARPPLWFQSRSNDGIVLRGVRIVDNAVTSVRLFNSQYGEMSGSAFNVKEAGPYTFTVDPNTDTFTCDCSNPGLAYKQRIAFTTAGTLPAPLVAYTTTTQYFVRNISGNTFQVENASAVLVDITDTGSGAHTFHGMRGPSFDCTPSTGRSGNYGCEDWYIGDVQFDVSTMYRNHLDAVAIERGNRILIERSHIAGDCTDSRTTAACGDAWDLKASNLTLNRVTAKGARNLIKLWGDENRLTNGAAGGHNIWEAIVAGIIVAATINTAETSGDNIKLTVTLGDAGGTIPRGAVIDVSGVTGCPEAIGRHTVLGFGADTEVLIGPLACSTPGTGGTLDVVHGIHLQNVTSISGTGWHAFKYFKNDPRPFVATAFDNIYYHLSDAEGPVCGSSHADRDMDRNVVWSTRGTAYRMAFQDDGSSSCPYSADVASFETNSVNVNPALSTATFRATASSPASTWSGSLGTWSGGVWNKGYYAGLHELVGVSSTAAIVKNMFPSASESVTATVSVNTDFSAPVETLTITAKGAWRHIVFGKGTPLAASTTYYYKLQQGYDVVTGTFTTLAAAAGNETLSVAVTAPSGLSVADAVLETSADGSSWTPQSPVACVASCTLTASLTKDAVHYRRWKFRDGGTSVLVTSAAEPVSLR